MEETYFAIIDGLCWEADFLGEEIGFPTVASVGHFTKAVRFFSDDEDVMLNLYVDSSDGHIVAMWIEGPEYAEEDDWDDDDYMDNDWEDGEQ